MSKINVRLLGMLAIFAAFVVFAFANIVMADPPPAAGAIDPIPPRNLTVDNTTRLDPSNWATKMIYAEAGNLTHLTIHGVTQTMTWQGYYGQITGTITLDDAWNNTMYDWHMAEPEGQIHASNNSYVNWTQIKCFNFTADGINEINLTIVEEMYGLEPYHYDGVDETFNRTAHPLIYVGIHPIAENSCPSTNTYINSTRQTEHFTQMLLTDTDAIIFTTIIEKWDVYGFNGVVHDFQMMVGDKGRDGDTEVTPYYFFVELQ